MKVFLTALIICLASVLSMQASAGAGGGPKPKYFVDKSTLPFDALPGATAYWGVHRRAGYRIEVPDDWNGDLVMWAHGFRGTAAEGRVSTNVDDPSCGASRARMSCIPLAKAAQERSCASSSRWERPRR